MNIYKLSALAEKLESDGSSFGETKKIEVVIQISVQVPYVNEEWATSILNSIFPDDKIRNVNFI